MPKTTVTKETPAWQQAYAAELLRTINRTATFASKGGGWWSLAVDGKDTFEAYRKSDILAMTERLKVREDHCVESSKLEA